MPCSVSEVMQDIGYEGRPELFSMLCCFACDVGFRYTGFNRFDPKAWTAYIAEYKWNHGVVPLPVVVAQHLRAG